MKSPLSGKSTIRSDRDVIESTILPADSVCSARGMIAWNYDLEIAVPDRHKINLPQLSKRALIGSDSGLIRIDLNKDRRNSNGVKIENQVYKIQGSNLTERRGAYGRSRFKQSHSKNG